MIMRTMQFLFLRFCHLKSVQNLCANACDHGIVFLASIPCISVRAVSAAWEGGEESWTTGPVSSVQATKRPGGLPLVPGRRHQALLQYAFFYLPGMVTYYESIILCPIFSIQIGHQMIDTLNHGFYIRWRLIALCAHMEYVRHFDLLKAFG